MTICSLCNRSLGYQDGEWYDVDGLTYAPDGSHGHDPVQPDPTEIDDYVEHIFGLAVGRLYHYQEK